MRVFAAIAAMLTVTLAASAQNEARIEVSTRQPSVGSYFQISIITTERASSVTFPVVDGLDIDTQSPQSSTSFQSQIIGGRFQSQTEYRLVYNATALREGRITIPPVTVKAGGREYKTDSTIIIAGPRSTPPPVSRGNAGQPRLTIDDAIFLRSSINKPEVYKGEEVVVTLELWEVQGTNLQVMGPALEDPDLTGFYALPEVQTQRREVANGLTYRVSVVSRYLYPLETGEFTLGPWVWSARLLAGFNMVPKRMQSEVHTVKVKALPSVPAEFSGAVGEFTVDAQLTPSEVVQGAPARLQVTIRGRGNPDTIGGPKVPELDWAHVAEPEIALSEPTEQNNWTAGKTFLYPITPFDPGPHVVPEMSLTYFDPETSQYKSDTFGPFSLNVKPSGEGERLVTAGGVQTIEPDSVEILGLDINPILRSAPALRAKRSDVLGTGAMALFPPFAYAGFFLYVRRKRRFEADPRYARDYFARTKSKKRLAAIEQGADPSDALFRAVIGFLADKFDVSEAGMTSADARQLLDSRRVPAEYAETLAKVLRACERRRYGGAELSRDELGALRQGAERAMNGLEAALKKGGRK